MQRRFSLGAEKGKYSSDIGDILFIESHNFEQVVVDIIKFAVDKCDNGVGDIDYEDLGRRVKLGTDKLDYDWDKLIYEDFVIVAVDFEVFN